MKSIHVKSEIGPLKKVLLHRPGAEIENLTPEILERLLFDDIPYLKVAREEHDAFADILRQEGVEVCYVEELITETLDRDADLKERFIEQFIREAGVVAPGMTEALKTFFSKMTTSEMIYKMIAGVRDIEVKVKNAKSLTDLVKNDYPFTMDPLPNLYFQRDPFASMGNGITINKMHTETRRRETIFAHYIFNYHPDYKDNLEIFYNRYDDFSLEGGDELVLNATTLAIGISERTRAAAIEELAYRLFFEKETEFETVLAFRIPKKRAFMHLDTVFTQIDYDKFTIHPEILGTLEVYELTKGEEDVEVERVESTLEEILSKHLGRDVELILCGDGDVVASGREQWNDGANTLCIAPGVVVVYSRNWVTNEKLRSIGIRVIEMPSSELSRGRGGPRCMSMPLIREDI